MILSNMVGTDIHDYLNPPKMELKIVKFKIKFLTHKHILSTY